MNRVVLVGAGCGKGMLTLRGAEYLKQCDCVVYDSLLDEEILALAKPSCKKIFAGKRAGAHSMPQDKICALLTDCAERYPLTVRLKGGDPFVFGRGGEEVAALAAAGVACEVVPGVSAAVAAAEFAGIPVTHRGVSRGFRVMTAHTADGPADYPGLAHSSRETLVFLMAKASAGGIAAGLMAGGMSGDMPSALISGAGMPGMQVRRCKLKELSAAAQDMPAPLTAVVGMVCAPELLAAGAAVAVTGTPSHTERVCGALWARGVAAYDCAHLTLRPRRFDGIFSMLARYEWLVFTSPNGVDIFFARAKELGIGRRAFDEKKIAAIGDRTAETLRRNGFCADLVPSVFTADALARALGKAGAPKERVALLRASSGNEALLCVGEQIDLYDTVADGARLAFARQVAARAKCVTFGSASGARALLKDFRLPQGCVPVCIGEETARELRRLGYRPVVAASADAEALADAVTAVK